MKNLLPSFDRNGLIYRWLLVNILLISIVTVIELQKGWLSDLLAADAFFISHGLIAGFLVGLVWSGIKAFKVNTTIKSIGWLIKGYHEKLEEKGQEARGDLRESFKTDLMAYISVIGTMFEILVFVGMLGTISGLIFATAGIDPQSIADPSNAGITVSQVIGGLSIALHTTLVGGITGLWLKINHLMMAAANAHIFSKVLRG